MTDETPKFVLMSKVKELEELRNEMKYTAANGPERRKLDIKAKLLIKIVEKELAKRKAQSFTFGFGGSREK